MHWPYENIEYSDLEMAIQRVERIIQGLGAVYVAMHSEDEKWIWGDGKIISETVQKKIFRFQDVYVQVDKILFPDIPFIVLEFSDRIEGPYEDADPFPYDLVFDEMEHEIKFAMLFERE